MTARYRVLNVAAQFGCPTHADSVDGGFSQSSTFLKPGILAWYEACSGVALPTSAFGHQNIQGRPPRRLVQPRK